MQLTPSWWQNNVIFQMFGNGLTWNSSQSHALANMLEPWAAATTYPTVWRYLGHHSGLKNTTAACPSFVDRTPAWFKVIYESRVANTCGYDPIYRLELLQRADWNAEGIFAKYVWEACDRDGKANKHGYGPNWTNGWS